MKTEMRKHFRYHGKKKKGNGYEARMEGLFPLSRMVAGGWVFGEEGKVLPSTSSMITGLEMSPRTDHEK